MEALANINAVKSNNDPNTTRANPARQRGWVV
jgi:hypothetical protein